MVFTIIIVRAFLLGASSPPPDSKYTELCRWMVRSKDVLFEHPNIIMQVSCCGVIEEGLSMLLPSRPILCDSVPDEMVSNYMTSTTILNIMLIIYAV